MESLSLKNWFEVEIGKTYTRHNKYGGIVGFPFRENVGVFTGKAKNGWLQFNLSYGKVCSINGGWFKEATINDSEKEELIA